MGENVSPKPVLWLSCSQYVLFWEKNIKTVFGSPFPTVKVIVSFVVQHPLPWKMAMSPKNYFSLLVWKILFVCFFFFFEKIVQWKIFKTLFPTNKVILSFLAKCPLPLKTVISFHRWFSQFFQCKLKNINEVFLLESILI